MSRPESQEQPEKSWAAKRGERVGEIKRQWLDVWAAVEIDKGAVGFPTLDAIRDPERSPMTLLELVRHRSRKDGKVVEREEWRTILDPKSGLPVEVDPIEARTNKPLAAALCIHASVEMALGVGFAYHVRRKACAALYPRSGKFSALGIDLLSSVEGRSFTGPAATAEGKRRDDLEARLPVDRWEVEALVLRRLAERETFRGKEADDLVRLLKAAHGQVLRALCV